MHVYMFHIMHVYMLNISQCTFMVLVEHGWKWLVFFCIGYDSFRIICFCQFNEFITDSSLFRIWPMLLMALWLFQAMVGKMWLRTQESGGLHLEECIPICVDPMEALHVSCGRWCLDAGEVDMWSILQNREQASSQTTVVTPPKRTTTTKLTTPRTKMNWCAGVESLSFCHVSVCLRCKLSYQFMIFIWSVYLAAIWF